MKKQDLEQILPQVRAAFPPFFSNLGVRPDYSLHSVKQLEAAIRVYPAGQTPSPQTVFTVGLYLGEVLIRLVPNSRWILEDLQFLSDFRLQVGDVVSLPVLRAGKYWADPTETLYEWCCMIQSIANGQLDPQQVQPGEWLELGDGTKVRFNSID